MATQQPIIAATFQCGWVPEQHDYSLVVLPGAVNFDSEGNPSAATVSVNVYHTVDGERLPLAVNTSAASHYLLAITTLANGKLRLRAATSLDAASLSTAVALRFDLVAKADVTVPSSSNYIYDEGAILRSESVSLTHDGTQGGFTSIAFTRTKTQPGTPSGGTYDDPVPTTAGWSDAPPADDPNDPKPLWMSRARFEPSTTDQQGWSEPVPVADDVDIEFIFTPNEEYDTPEKTHPHPKYTNGEGDGWGKDATDAVWMAIAKKSGGAWGDWNVMRVKGESAYTLDLDNEMEAIPCDHNGTPTQTGTLATSNAKVYKGGKPDTEGWSFYHADTGCKASMIAGKVTVTEISADKATVKVIATKGSVSLSAVMSLYKAKAGGPGEDAVVYSIGVSANSISRDKDGNLNPATITATKTKTTGAAYADTKEKVLTCRLEGTAYASDNVLADTSKESGTVSNIPDSCTAVIFKLYENYGSSSAKVLDRERVPIVSDGRDGKGLAGVTDYYAVSASKTTAPTEWNTTIPTMTPVNRYLWNYEEVTYSDGSVEETAKRVIGVYGDKGVGISDVEEYFLATSLGSGVTADHDTYAWTKEVQSVSAEKKYLWNYEKTIYTDGSARATEPHIIGTYGRDGKDGKDGEDGKDGKDGAPGKTGPMVPPPMLWGDYEEGYEFQDGATRVNQGDEPSRTDVVVWTQNADKKWLRWLCIKSHKKSTANSEPGVGSRWQTYWEQCDGPFDLLASKVVLADNAYIGLMSGNAIRIYNSAREIVGQMSSVDKAPTGHERTLPFFIGGVLGDAGFGDGNQPLFAVDENGVSYHGGITGQHIEINPLRKALDVFDKEGNLCATHSGRAIQIAEVAATVGTGSFGGSARYSSGTLTADGTWNTTLIEPASALAAGGGLTVEVPSFGLTGSRHTTPSGPDPYPAMIGQVDLMVYANGRYVGGGLIGRLYAGVAPEQRETTAAFTRRVPLSKGDTYSVAVRVQTWLGTNGSFSATSNALPVKASFTGDAYRCEFGANGFFLAQNTSNYIYVLFENSQLHVKAVSGGTKIFGNDN